MTRNVESIFGAVVTAPHQIPYTYTATGGETFISLPFYPVTGFITINGGVQVPVDNYEIDGNTVNLGRALEADDVVYCLFDKILSPEDYENGIRIYKFQADGNETTFTPDFTTYGVQSLYVDGKFQVPGVNYSYNSTTGVVSFLTGSPAAGVWVVSEMSVKQNYLALASDNGASLVGTTSGQTVQQSLDSVGDDLIKLKLNWAIENGYADSGLTFSVGGTLTINDRDKVVYDPVSKTWYSWSGALPHVIAASTNPVAVADWTPQTDPNLRNDLAASSGATLVGTSSGVTVEQAIINARHAVYFNAADYKTGSNTWSQAINAALAAAKLASTASNTVFVPAATEKYFVKDIVIDSPANLIGAGKLNTTFCPENDGDTCFKVTHEFARLADFTIQSVTVESTSTGIRIEAPLVTVENCSFAFLKYCVDAPGGYGAGELDFRFNRFAASTYGVVLGGGQINTRFNQNTFNGCKCGLFITENSSHVSTNIEGIELLGDRFYACGDNTLGTAAIEIVNCRWIWLTDVMSDLATGIALRATNTQYLQLTNGYYSSNRSGNKSCVVIQGSCNEFMATGVKFSDSRYFGLEIIKEGGLVPARPKLVNCLFQNNDIDAAQQGDLLVNSVVGVTAENCTFLANKPLGITVLDNQTGGSSVTTKNCYFYGQVFVGGASCKFYHYDSPTHPDKQVGLVTIPNGVGSVTAAVGIVSLVSGRSIAVTATSASQLASVAAGVSGSNYQFTRSGTSGDFPLSYNAVLIQN
ncbi:tailspike protein [Shigella phage Ag3]|uniref:Tailspike protein n=1 Tax=Shigella phage Ag3 TaxID=637730 RepID=C8XUT0_9CAUD|nr:tail spike protein [Shigella phage Ag3]ACO94410.1 tailspike protein [Shigella phage Ag3]